MDWERHFCIVTGSSLQEGSPYVRDRWQQQVYEDNTKADLEKGKFGVPQPKAADYYYTCCAKIDQCNRNWRDTMEIDQKLWTHDWSICGKMSILALCFVDSWQVYALL